MTRATTVIAPLGRWGLSPHADLVYRTLTLSGPATGAQLSRQVDVPEARIGRAVEELFAVGAVRPGYHGRERVWSAVEPGRVTALLQRRRHPAAVGEVYQRHLATVAGLHLDRIPPGLLRRLPTRQATRGRIAELAAAERHEHLAINTEDVISPDAVAAADPVDRALLARGVRLRTLGRPRRGVTWREPLPGSEHREAESLPLKLMVFDRRAAIFPADPADFEAGAVEVADPDAVDRLVQVFCRLWVTAADPQRQGVPPIMLTTREQAILDMLAAGHSEQTAAHELGLSRRTVVYALRGLMDRLGVENRFQLALVLGAAHAIAVPSPAVPATHPVEESR
ncbi:LuxR family transcriptional regulator [Amorphoplanes nipponensis]|uniref:Transcriptional regulator n=1 Tax=Actinoplanes nipponensis TaxID=135950 RepID=A0A919MQM2_9ACTN|nr:LuxR family transcriptional regulator [Actinoplanes nipponensis]GIE53796.1 transcriptional regulator [Actinoplanes nipponensis]